MASSVLRPHRSPSPTPSPQMTPVNPSNPAKLTRQSLGPPSTASSGAARGFAGLGISSPSYPHPRHVSSSVALGFGSGVARDSPSPRPSLGNSANRVPSGSTGRPSSEFLPGGGGATRDAKTPEGEPLTWCGSHVVAEQIDQWFQHLASWEQTLEEMAAASTDQNFTEELGAIEQWFRVLSEAERTAALYSLLQHSTPVQIRFFLSVLHHMAQTDPMSALLSPNPAQSGTGLESRLASMGLKSPSAGGGAGFPGSPTVNQYLAPETADQNKSRLRQNRISAPGTLQPSDRWHHSQLDQVIERGTSPGVESNTSGRSLSPGPDARPKSTDFSGQAGNTRSARHSAGVGLGIGHPETVRAGSPVTSPYMNNGSWASMVNTPLVPMFSDPKVDLGLANLQLNANRVALDDARQYRRQASGTARNVSGQYNDNGDLVDAQSAQPGRGQAWARSPVLDQYGLGMSDNSSLAGLGMNLLNPLANAQMLALAQAQAQQLSTAASFASAGFGGLNPNTRGPARPPVGPGPVRRSPLLGKSHSPTPDRGGAGGGGAGGGAGVAGVDDIDLRILEDVSSWLRVLRLHKYTRNFERSKWSDMIMMTDKDLIAKGVSAQGARTKFLKVFYNVREKEGIPHPAGQEEYAPGVGGKDDK